MMSGLQCARALTGVPVAIAGEWQPDRRDDARDDGPLKRLFRGLTSAAADAPRP
ncbi:Hypothetical protein A7982_06648 [Minicystis rosea]|nr:Hypothetical protein A7982_06648 [Minicystis rosea]